MLSRNPLLLLTGALALLLLCPPAPLQAQKLGFTEQISTETYARLREVERHQIKVAEKFFLKGEYAVAMDEYDKFLQLYPESPGAPYSQLMWGNCQRRLRHVNTAIREGYQSVIDYWPDSPEAILAAYAIPVSQKEMGETGPATKAFRKAIETHPEHQIALLSRVHLLDMARVAQDAEARLGLLEELTFKMKRAGLDKGGQEHCASASRELAGIRVRTGDIEGSLEALRTTYSEERIPFALDDTARDGISQLFAQKEDAQKKLALRISDGVMSALEAALPDNPGADESRGRSRDLLYRISGLYGRTGRDEGVFKTYERVAKLTGMDDDVRSRYAQSYRHRGKRDEARQWYAKFDNQIEAQRQIAGLFREESKWIQAIETYAGLVERDPDRASEYQWAIAECYEQSGDQRKAIAAYRLSDNFPSAYFRMATCHRRLKEWGEALGLYAQCKAIPSHSAEAHMQTGHTLEQAGRREDAITTFQGVCRTFPKTSQGSRAHAHLQEKYKINITLGGGEDE